MQIIHIEKTKRVKKTKKELAKEMAQYKGDKKGALGFIIGEYKVVPTNKPTYIVEMSQEELQLVSFYLELEKRKPIMNVKLDVEKENDK